jgi:hypothetical protein
VQHEKIEKKERKKVLIKITFTFLKVRRRYG